MTRHAPLLHTAPRRVILRLAARAGETSRDVVMVDPAADPAPGRGDALLDAALVASIDGVREECVRFGPDARAVGVLTRPAASRRARDSEVCARPPVLLLHTGADHHVGPNRMWPVWAREWARDGTTTLRFDPLGLGDSSTTPGLDDAAFTPYGAERLAEILTAAEYLCERTGAERVVVLGVCSGAYYAVHAAAAGLRAARVIAVNPQFYQGHEPLDRAAVEGHRAPAALGGAALDGQRWGRLLRGETSARRVATMVSAGAGYALRAAVATATKEARAFADRRSRRGDGPLGDLWRLYRAAVPVTLVFAREDEGWAYLRVQARVAWRTYQRRRHARVHVLDATHHTFVRAWMQRRLRALVDAELGVGG